MASSFSAVSLISSLIASSRMLSWRFCSSISPSTRALSAAFFSSQAIFSSSAAARAAALASSAAVVFPSRPLITTSLVSAAMRTYSAIDFSNSSLLLAASSLMA
jgi:hypothetical protein